MNSTNSYVYVNRFNEGDRIGEDLPWQPYNSLFWVLARHVESASVLAEVGEWPGASGEFAGLRLTLGNQSFYGWIRLDVDSDAAQFAVHDFAVQAIPDSSILAGDRDSLTAIQAVPAINQIYIAAMGRNIFIDNSFEGASPMIIQIRDIAGRERWMQTTQQKQVRIELPQWAPGIYLVSVTTAGVMKSKKISLR